MANYNDILKKYGLDNTPPSPSSYDDILNKYGVKPAPSATLGNFTVEQSAPKVWDPEQRASLMSTPATVQGAANQFVDRTQAAMSGLVSAAAGGAQQIYNRSLAPALSLIGIAGGNRPSFENVNQAVSGTLGGIEQAGTDVARAEMRSSNAAREEALAAGANELGMDFLTALGDVGIQVGSTLATRNPTLGAGVAAAQVYGPDYARRLEEGVSKEDAAKGALARSGVEVGTTLPALGVLGRLFGQGGEQAASRIVNTLEGSVAGRAVLGATAEGTQEAAANMISAGVDYGLGYSDKPFGDVGEALREGGIGAGVGAAIGAMSPGRTRIPAVQTGIPVADAAAQATADIQAAAGVSVEPTESSQNAVSPPTPTTPTGLTETPSEERTEASRAIPRSQRIRARLNLETGQFETEGGLPVDSPSAADFERAEMETGIEMFRKRPQERARQRGIDVDGLLNNAVAPQETPPVLQNAMPLAETTAVEAPVAQAESQSEAPSNSNYIRRAMQLANEEGIDATPEWLQQRVSQLQNEDVSEMAIRGGVSPSTLSYYTTAEEIPQEYRNTTSPPESQLPVVNAIKTATNAREAVDALRPLIQSESLRSFADKIGSYIDLAEIPVITVNPEDAGRDIGAANYLVAKGKERTVGAYSPATREIYLKGEGWKNNGMSAEALLHELQHAASVHVYEAVERGTLTDERAVKAVNDIKALATEFSANSKVFDSFPKETRDRLRYAAGAGKGSPDPKEFMAITQTSPLVQSALKKEGLWKRFVNAIRGMFGYSRSEAPLLERILTAGDEVMGAQQQAQLATAPPAAGTVVNEADFEPGDLSFEEMALGQSTRDRLREESAQASANYYENVPTWAKTAKRAISWTGNKDPRLARAMEQLQLEKAAVGVYEREIAQRGDRINRIIRKQKLDGTEVLAQVDNIIRGQQVPQGMDPTVLKEAQRLRTLVDGFQVELLQSMEATGQDPRATDEMLDKIYNSIGSYISRSYLRSYWQPGAIEKSMLKGKEGAAWTKYMKATHPQIYKNLVRWLDVEMAIPMSSLETQSPKKLTWMAEQFGVDPGNLKSTKPGTNITRSRERVIAELGTIANKFASPEVLRNFVVDALSFTDSNSPIAYARGGTRDEGILEKRTDLPQEIRDWWLENTNPIIATAITVDRVGTLAAETRFLNRVLENGIGTYIFDETHPAPKGESLERLNNANLGALNGKLVPSEMKQFLDAQLGLSELKTSDDVKALFSGIVNNVIVRPGQLSKFMSTVASLPTAAMNIQSNAVLALNDSLVMSVFQRLSPDARFSDFTPTQLLKASIMDVMRSVENTEQVKKLVGMGILRDTLTLGELRSQTRRLERELATAADPRLLTRGARRLNNAVQQVGDVMADFYQVSDNAPRLIQFASQLSGLSKAYPDLDKASLLDMAADRSRNNVPTFGRASPLVRGPSKYLGNFATWSGEVVRSYAWRSKYAYDDITKGLKEGNPALVTHGIAQAVATSSSMVANYYGTKLIMAGMGYLLGAGLDGDEEDSVYDKLKNLVPEWLSDKNLIPWEVDKENKRVYVINTTRNDPAAPFQEVANRLDNEGASGFLTYVRDNVLMPGAWLQGAAQAVSGKRRPIEAIMKGDDVRDVRDIKDQVRPVIEAFVPGTLRQIGRAVKQYGQGSDAATQSLRAIGLNIEEVDVTRGIEDRAYTYGDDKLAIGNALRSRLSSPDPMTEEDFKSYLSDYLNDSRDLFEQMQETMTSAKDVVGMTNAELSSILKDASGSTNGPERTRLLSGKYTPRTFDKDWLDGVKQRALDTNVRDPAYTERVEQEFKQRRQWLNTYLGSPRKWQPLLENDDAS